MNDEDKAKLIESIIIAICLCFVFSWDEYRSTDGWGGHLNESTLIQVNASSQGL